MKQPDVDVSQPALVRNPYLTLTLVTFDLDPEILSSESLSIGDGGDKNIVSLVHHGAQGPEVCKVPLVEHVVHKGIV